MPKYKATAYIRLSYTDDHSSESDSVSNQRKLIENFVPEAKNMTDEEATALLRLALTSEPAREYLKKRAEGATS